MTICFHIDDLMSSHQDPKINNEFLNFLNDKYGQPVEVKATRGKCHNYLGMTFKFEDGKVKVDMRDYIMDMLSKFPIKFDKEKKYQTQLQ